MLPAPTLSQSPQSNGGRESLYPLGKRQAQGEQTGWEGKGICAKGSEWDFEWGWGAFRGWSKVQ